LTMDFTKNLSVIQAVKAPVAESRCLADMSEVDNDDFGEVTMEFTRNHSISSKRIKLRISPRKSQDLLRRRRSKNKEWNLLKIIARFNAQLTSTLLQLMKRSKIHRIFSNQWKSLAITAQFALRLLST